MIMEKQNSPATWGRCFFLGLGIGTGITIGLYVAKKLSQSNCSHELVLAVNDMSHEIRELRSCLMINYEKTNSSDRLKKLYRCVSSHEVTTKTEYLAPEESSTEDDFFDLQEDDEQISNSERLQGGGIVLVDKLIKECDDLTEKADIADSEKEFRILEDLLAKNPNNVEVLWRFARAHEKKASLLSQEGDEEGKKNILYKGMKFIDKALEVDENNGDAHKWYAILLGITADYKPLKERLALGHRYKEHILRAIQLKPKDPSVYHLMGRWSFEVAKLSWWQRQAAATFIGEPPSATYDEALSNFNKAEQLSPGFWKSNALFIGKCYQQLGDMTKAKEWIQKSLDLPVKHQEDKKAHEEAKTILAGL